MLKRDNIIGNYLVIQKRVYDSLPQQKRQAFVEYRITEEDYRIRDDPAAKSFYYLLVETSDNGESAAWCIIGASISKSMGSSSVG